MCIVNAYRLFSCANFPMVVKFELKPNNLTFAQSQVDEAKMLNRIARQSPTSVCALLYQPRLQDMDTQGRKQPLFIGMEPVTCVFGDMLRKGLSRMRCM